MDPRRLAKTTLLAGVHKLGFDLVRHAPASRATALKERRITLVLDVGANEGGYAKSLRRAGYRGRIVSFEPVPAVFEQLAAAAAADGAWEARPLALSDVDGRSPISVGADTRVSSLRRQAAHHRATNPEWATVEVAEVNVARLDSIASTLVDPNDRIFLKVDVQGTELEVLQGAEKTLTSVYGIEIELSLAPVYEGQALVPELMAFLYDNGFRLVWLERAFIDRVSGYLHQADGIFIRDDAS